MIYSGDRGIADVGGVHDLVVVTLNADFEQLTFKSVILKFVRATAVRRGG
jgi:hypothetical protein